MYELVFETHPQYRKAMQALKPKPQRAIARSAVRAAATVQRKEYRRLLGILHNINRSKRSTGTLASDEGIAIKAVTLKARNGWNANVMTITGGRHGVLHENPERSPSYYAHLVEKGVVKGRSPYPGDYPMTQTIASTKTRVVQAYHQKFQQRLNAEFAKLGIT